MKEKSLFTFTWILLLDLMKLIQPFVSANQQTYGSARLATIKTFLIDEGILIAISQMLPKIIPTELIKLKKKT